MKKHITVLLLIFFSVSINVFGQSKRETQEWIKFILESNTIMGQVCDIRFSTDGSILSYYSVGGPSLSEMKTHYEDIPIKQIKKITFQLGVDRKSVYMNIEISKGGPRVHSGTVSGNYPSGKFQKKEGIITQIKEWPYATIWSLKPDIIYDGINERILKAFSHLVKLNGGIMVDEMF